MPRPFILLICRSICPGRYLAKDNTFIVAASVLHVFNICASVDEHGNELDPSPTFGIVTYAYGLLFSERRKLKEDSQIPQTACLLFDASF